jgi:hypothetical protein
VADRRQVHADLVHAPGARAHLQQRGFRAQALGDPELRHRAAGFDRRRSGADRGGRAEGLLDAAASPHRARDERQIDALDGVRVELPGQLAVRGAGLATTTTPLVPLSGR